MFDATNSAFVFDLLLSVAPNPGTAYAQCAHNVAEAARTLDLSSKASLKKLLLDGVVACSKGAAGAVIDLPGLFPKAQRPRSGRFPTRPRYSLRGEAAGAVAQA